MFIEHFADGSDDCPLILLHGRDPAAAARLLERVRALAASRAERVSVHELEGFESVEGCELFLSLGMRDIGTQRLGVSESFECHLRPSTWNCVEGLLEPFTVRSFRDGFQWLDSHGQIQLLISGHRGW